ncbi:hypothetical protein ACW9HR_32840 [Nocardia gipuzkoensis]
MVARTPAYRSRDLRGVPVRALKRTPTDCFAATPDSGRDRHVPGVTGS